jgi:hypothetical protein
MGALVRLPAYASAGLKFAYIVLNIGRTVKGTVYQLLLRDSRYTCTYL